MRFFQASLLLAFLAAIGIFAIQNNTVASVKFLGWGVSAPLPALIVGVYLLGMISGGAVFGFLTRSIRKVSEQQTPPR